MPPNPTRPRLAEAPWAVPDDVFPKPTEAPR